MLGAFKNIVGVRERERELDNVAAESVQHRVLSNPVCCQVKLVLGLSPQPWPHTGLIMIQHIHLHCRKKAATVCFTPTLCNF